MHFYFLYFHNVDNTYLKKGVKKESFIYCEILPMIIFGVTPQILSFLIKYVHLRVSSLGRVRPRVLHGPTVIFFGRDVNQMFGNQVINMEFIGVKILVVVPIVVVFTCPLSHLYLLKTFVFYSLHLQTSILKTKTMDLPPLDFLFDFEL